MPTVHHAPVMTWPPPRFKTWRGISALYLLLVGSITSLGMFSFGALANGKSLSVKCETVSNVLSSTGSFSFWIACYLVLAGYGLLVESEEESGKDWIFWASLFLPLWPLFAAYDVIIRHPPGVSFKNFMKDLAWRCGRMIDMEVIASLFGMFIFSANMIFQALSTSPDIETQKNNYQACLTKSTDEGKKEQLISILWDWKMKQDFAGAYFLMIVLSNFFFVACFSRAVRNLPAKRKRLHARD